jgi:hypothetical protein
MWIASALQGAALYGAWPHVRRSSAFGAPGRRLSPTRRGGQQPRARPTP